MPLLESGYKAAAKTELERDIRELEAKDKAAQSLRNPQAAFRAISHSHSGLTLSANSRRQK